MAPRSSLTTRVAIVGGGPAGLLLSHLLHRSGIDNVVLELRDRDYTVQRVRAGVLEHDAVALLTEEGLGDRLRSEGLRHDGIYLQFAGERHHIDFAELVGRHVWIYGQQEVVKDLIAAHDANGTPARYEVTGVEVVGIDSDAPAVLFSQGGEEFELGCDFVVGADGFHGVSRLAIPKSDRTTYEREYDFGWLGILAHTPPSSDELVYALHERGFALLSMRSPTVSRLYLQVPPGENIADWPDDRIWDELDTRLALPGWTLERGEIFDKSVTPMRSFVSTPMRHGSLFLAGDAAHIVPPTGAKGLNSAIADVALLRRGLVDHYERQDDAVLDSYSETQLSRSWQTQYFSTWMTRMLHTFSGPDAVFDHQVQLGQLAQLVGSAHAKAHLAEFYTGLPITR
ncbi:MAG: 4-hydroxybenzoate 3-monooxygenase [Microbacteriaceae bacterium]|nr:4-hydroxybenzoate 3-monooxygenase [Microbacteriaceae bacterium]